MYLDALNITHVDDPVTVLIVDPDGSLAALGDAVVAGRRNLRAVRVGADELTAKTGIDRASLQATEDALPLFLLGLETPDFNLAPPTLTAGYSRHLAARAIYALMAVVAGVGLAWFALDIYRMLDLRHERQQVIAQTRSEQNTYQEITRTFPPAPASSERLKLTVDVAGRIAAMARLPDKTYRVVGQALDGNPDLTLNGFTWKHGHTGSEPAAPGQLAQSALLQIELLAAPGDFTSALNTVNKFTKDLGRNEWVASARTTKLPIDPGSSATLRGSTAVRARSSRCRCSSRWKWCSSPGCEAHMQLSLKDLSALGRPLLLLALIAGLVAGGIVFAERLVKRAKADLASAESDLVQARERVKRSGDERDTIKQYVGSYRELEQRGVLGEEQRLGWVDALRAANNRAQLYGVEYEVGAQQPFAFSTEAEAGKPAGTAVHHEAQDRSSIRRGSAEFFPGAGQPERRCVLGEPVQPAATGAGSRTPV